MIDPSSSGMKKCFRSGLRARYAAGNRTAKAMQFAPVALAGISGHSRGGKRQVRHSRLTKSAALFVRILEGKGPTHDRSPCRQVWARGLRAAVGAQRRGRGAEDGSARGENDGLGSALFGKDHKPADHSAAAVGVSPRLCVWRRRSRRCALCRGVRSVIVAKVHASIVLAPAAIVLSRSAPRRGMSRTIESSGTV